jgi:hypothetical protein
LAFTLHRGGNIEAVVDAGADFESDPYRRIKQAGQGDQFDLCLLLPDDQDHLLLVNVTCAHLPADDLAGFGKHMRRGAQPDTLWHEGLMGCGIRLADDQFDERAGINS